MNAVNASLTLVAEPDAPAVVTWHTWRNRRALALWRERVAAHVNGAVYADPRDAAARDRYSRIELRAAWLRGQRPRVVATG